MAEQSPIDSGRRRRIAAARARPGFAVALDDQVAAAGVGDLALLRCGAIVLGDCRRARCPGVEQWP